MGHQLGSLSAGCAGGVNLDVPGGMPAGAILVPSGQAAILSFTMAVWVTFFSWFFLGEKPSRRLLAGLALTCCGVGLLIFGGRRALLAAPELALPFCDSQRGG